MGSKAPIHFDEARFQQLGEQIVQFYYLLGQLIIKGINNDDWKLKFGCLKSLLRQSCEALDDSNLAAVNYCRLTLDPLAKYHEINTRICRELEDMFHDRGPKIITKHMEANAEEFLMARYKIVVGWKLDVMVAAKRKGQ
jgi:hypothetical protein